MIKNTVYLFLFSITYLFSAIQSPSYETLRAQTMGNAFVAFANKNSALNYNIAGLFHRKKHIEPHYFHLFGETLLGDLALVSFFPFSNQHADFFQEYADQLANIPENNLQQLRPDFNQAVSDLNLKPFVIRGQAEVGLVTQSFGISAWTNTRTYAYIGETNLIPDLGFFYSEFNYAIQTGFAFSISKYFNLGIGARFLEQRNTENLRFPINQFETVSDVMDSLTDSYQISHGVSLDFGVLYQVLDHFFIGASFQNIFIIPLKETVIPELTFGISYAPNFLQNNTSDFFQREITLTADYENILISKDKFENHINLGIEYLQQLFGSSLVSRVAAGFNEGFIPTFGLGIKALNFISVDYGTWTEDLRLIDQGADENTHNASFVYFLKILNKNFN